MHNARDSDWLRHLFRYRQQLRADGRILGANEIETLKLVAACVLCEVRPSVVRIAHESTFLSDHAVHSCIGRLSTLGVVRPRGLGFTTGPPETWQGYKLHLPDPVDIDRLVREFIRDLDARVTDLARRQPKKRTVR
jgi:hypothetical protein